MYDSIQKNKAFLLPTGVRKAFFRILKLEYRKLSNYGINKRIITT